MGNGSAAFTAQAVPVSGLTDVVSVDVGAFTPPARSPTRRRGAGDRTASASSGTGRPRRPARRVTVTGLSGVVEIDAGGNHSCARLADGTGGAPGAQHRGRARRRRAHVPLDGGTGASVDVTSPDLTTGSLHTCAVVAGGTARCWGFNGNGQLGDGTTTVASSPVTVSGLTGASALAGGAATTRARQSDATLQRWGYNGGGGLGDTTRTQRLTPVDVAAEPLVVRDVVAVENGSIHTCILLETGTVECSGQGIVNGELGNGTFTNARILVPATGLSGVTAISAGENHTCAVSADTTLRCWGRNANGQLGDGTTVKRNVPVTVSGLTGVVQVEAGDDHTCAVLADTTVRCWGNNANGQLGDGTTTGSSTPVTVSGPVGGGVARRRGPAHVRGARRRRLGSLLG